MSDQHVIKLSETEIGYSAPFVAGPMLVRVCHNCGCLILDGTMLPHNAWHQRLEAGRG